MCVCVAQNSDKYNDTQYISSVRFEGRPPTQPATLLHHTCVHQQHDDYATLHYNYYTTTTLSNTTRL